LNKKIKPWRIRTKLHAGQPAGPKLTPFDRVVFVVLDVLQKPTDWVYARWIKKA
jgi:hypothetical protein